MVYTKKKGSTKDQCKTFSATYCENPITPGFLFFVYYESSTHFNKQTKNLSKDTRLESSRLNYLDP